MTTYAYISPSGTGFVVAQLIPLPTINGAVVPITDLVHADLTTVDVSTVAGIAPGWIATETNGTWSFAAPVVPALTLAQQAAALLTGGLAITSTATPALNATYPCDARTQAKLASVQTMLQATGAFPDGVTSMPIIDIAGTWHAATAAQYTAIAGAIASFVAALDLIIDGHPGSTTLPAATATIA